MSRYVWVGVGIVVMRGLQWRLAYIWCVGMDGEGLLPKATRRLCILHTMFFVLYILLFLHFLSYANIQYTFSASFSPWVERFVTFIEGFQKSLQLLFTYKLAIWSGDNWLLKVLSLRIFLLWNCNFAHIFKRSVVWSLTQECELNTCHGFLCHFKRAVDCFFNLKWWPFLYFLYTADLPIK